MSKRSCYHIPMNFNSKTITSPYLFSGTLAKVLLRNFITTHRGHVLTDVPWLLVTFAVHINGSHITI